MALEQGRRVLREAADALLARASRLNDTFEQAVEILRNCAGRVVVTGMGKSGIVGRKIAATLASTGTPALFLHPGEALHGDLGMVTPGDVLLALSYSGETDELLQVLPALKRRSSHLIALTGGANSTLAQSADVVLDVAVAREACLINLAPTTSTTVMITLGDALAVAVMGARGFGSEDYARLHPAGALGRRLLLHVRDIMRRGDAIAVVDQNTPLRDALFAITGAHAGAACVIDGTGRLIGILTDGDVRRFLLTPRPDALEQQVRDAMTRAPRTISGNPLAAEALALFERGTNPIGDLPVLDENHRPIGLLMLKDLMRAGIVSGEMADDAEAGRAES